METKMTKVQNLYSELVLNESPFFYDESGRLRVRVLEEQAMISTSDLVMDPTTGKTTPSSTIAVKDEGPIMRTAVPRQRKKQKAAMPYETTDAKLPNEAKAERKVAKAELRAVKGEKKEMKLAGKPIDPAMKEKLMAAKERAKAAVGKIDIRKMPAVPPKNKTTNDARQKPLRDGGKKKLKDFRFTSKSERGAATNTNTRAGLRGARPATDYLQEKINLKKAEMGEVIRDFQKSDAPQFKGKSKSKRRIMAIAAKLQAERG